MGKIKRMAKRDKKEYMAAYINDDLDVRDKWARIRAQNKPFQHKLYVRHDKNGNGECAQVVYVGYRRGSACHEV